jgi:hypothetical protein
MIEITLTDSNFGHQEYLTPHIKSEKIVWKRDGIRRKINVYTDNFIKSTHVDIPQDGNYNVCILLEPLTNPPWTDIYDYIQTDFEKFDLIITHNLGKLGHLIESRPDKFVYSTKCCTTSWLPKETFGIHNKTKKISMAFSSKNFAEGHRLRHEIYEKYKDTGLIDFYGSGVGEYQLDLRNCFTDYKYVIVCENTLQSTCQTEKLNDVLLNGGIPIYWGPKIIDENYDTKSIFRFSPDVEFVNFDFEESLQKLKNILDNIIQNDPYNELIQSIEHNYKYTLKTCQSEDNIYEILLQRNMINI